MRYWHERLPHCGKAKREFACRYQLINDVWYCFKMVSNVCSCFTIIHLLKNNYLPLYGVVIRN